MKGKRKHSRALTPGLLKFAVKLISRKDKGFRYKLNINGSNGYKIVFKKEISKSLFFRVFKQSLKKLDLDPKVTKNIDENKLVQKWTIEEGLYPKVVTAMWKNIDKIEKNVKAAKNAPKFSFITRNIPKDGYTYETKGKDVVITIIIEGDFTY